MPRRKQLEPVEIWLDKEIGVVACGHCGFAMILDAWSAMECDMFLPSEHSPLMSLEDAIAKYRPQGKMPGEKNYRPSLRAHWKVKLWRWRGIFGHTLCLLVGRGMVYKKTRRATIVAGLAKL